MTAVLLGLLGLGFLLIVSAFETDPTTGASPSILQTVANVWNGTVNFTQPSPQTTPQDALTSGGGGRTVM